MQTTAAGDSFQEMPPLHPSFPIVGIGASAGGLEAFTELLRVLPADTGMAYVLVQHLDPAHKSLLAGLLARATSMEVREARDGLTVEVDQVYVIPPNTDMTLAQDADSATCSSMPQSAIATGCVDFIGSPAQIAGELARMSRHPYLRQPPLAKTDEEEEPAPRRQRQQDLPQEERAFQQILRVLRRRTEVDFTASKPTTLKRRILRRMALTQMENFAGYLSSLADHPAEAEALYQDVLIGVTSFFREPPSLALLAREVFPRLVETKSTPAPVRVWVPGCSTGEEVYSLAICLLEFLAERSLTLPIQLFGTDLNAQAIERARAGLYSPGAVEQLSPARLERFFGRVNGDYQISKGVRDLCVFARHNLLSDPRSPGSICSRARIC
jgi:two-component system, chemotaxis family, CheB/CheR fusion protein